MTLEIIRDVLAWSAVINYSILLYWFVILTYAHDWVYQFHSRWFDLSTNTFDAIHYSAIAFYKLAIFLFNLVPYLALLIVL
ncbi:MAG: hypothetical protein GXP21_02830 [Gammaproteobacteria bacterium]|nr:hypothetical protein [Gammaproteobacteria bacterium]